MPILELPDAHLHYDLTGSGPPVIWIQGTGVTGSGWGPQIGDLSREFTCLSFDNRGIGQSTTNSRSLTIGQMAQDARALMDCAGWESAHVVGHSMGGLIAQQLAFDAPGRIRSLSLLCTFTKGPEAARVTPGVMWMGLQTRIGTRAMRRQAFLRMIFTREFLASKGTAVLAARVGPIVGRDLADSPPIMMRQLSAMRRYDRSAELPRLSAIPALVVSCDRDPIALPIYGRSLSAKISGSRYIELSCSSHAVILQSPSLVNELLREHLAAAEMQCAP